MVQPMVDFFRQRAYCHDPYRHDIFEICQDGIAEGLGACIELASVPVMPLYQFLFEQDMIGENAFPYQEKYKNGLMKEQIKGGNDHAASAKSRI